MNNDNKRQMQSSDALMSEAKGMRESFIAKRKGVSASYEDRLDTEFWFCVVFVDREHKERFLKHFGLIEYGDKYIDGDEALVNLGLAHPSEYNINQRG